MATRMKRYWGVSNKSGALDIPDQVAVDEGGQPHEGELLVPFGRQGGRKPWKIPLEQPRIQPSSFHLNADVADKPLPVAVVIGLGRAQHFPVQSPQHGPGSHPLAPGFEMHVFECDVDDPLFPLFGG